MTRKMLVRVLAGLVFTLAGWAQIYSNVNVTVPFPFFAGGIQMPAADYTVSSLQQGRVLLIRSADTKHATMINVNPRYTNTRGGASSLTFAKIGSTHLLTTVTDGVGQAEVVRWRTDKHLLRALAETGREAATVVIAGEPVSGAKRPQKER